ncbi:sigma factor-like helix-turn-helix DNA-binding protein [Lysobacter soli]|uniref:sigma factor-like helix-turn-helix DNA-binding protein n=1 Tax=Lysobacter soli TaxID=453783 RepID=UPI0036A04610
MLRAVHQWRAGPASSHAAALQRLQGMDADFPLPFDKRLPTPAERVWVEFLSVLDALPPTARAAFMLHDVFGATLEDVSIVLGQPPAACREHLAMARRCAHEHARRLASPTRPS